MDKFGQRIKEARAAKGWTQDDLADKAGVNVRGLQNYEQGKALPNLYTAVLIADTLGVSLDWLTGRAEE